MVAAVIGIFILIAYILAACHIAGMASEYSLSYGKFFFIGMFASPLISGIILLCELIKNKGNTTI